MTPDGALQVVFDRLSSFHDLSSDVILQLRRMQMDVRHVALGDRLAAAGDDADRVVVWLQGYGASERLSADGGRRILSFLQPGDPFGLQALHLAKFTENLVALTPSVVGVVPSMSIVDLCSNHREGASVIGRWKEVEAARERQRIFTMGQSATSRLAHLFCELMVRDAAGGVSDGRTTYFPLTQADLADFLAMSKVHANRSIQELRAAGLIAWEGVRLSILDWPRLRQAANFDDGYLHLLA